MAVDAMNVSVVAQVMDVRHHEEEVYLSCFNSEVERSVPATKLPMHNDLFVFRLNVPTSCSFNLRLFTRERLPSLSSVATEFFDRADDDPRRADAPRRGQSEAVPGRGDSEPRRSGFGGGLSAARPACSRVLRVEPLTHTVMTSPGWRTLLVTWNDHMQSWIKTDEDICGDDVLLMMQFPAGEIGRKMALNVSHPMTPDKFRAGEFPVGTECFWANMPVSASTADLLCTVRLVDKSTGTSVVYHPCLALSHIQTVAAAADPNDADSTMPASRGLVVSCQLDTNRHHIVAPVLYKLKRPAFVLSRD